MNVHVTEGDHADSLPDTETNTGSNTTVKAGNAVLVVNVLEGVANSHLLGTVGVLLLTLHLNADNLNGLIPGTKTTTKTASQDLLPARQLVAILLASGVADPALSKTAETETRTPVGHLADGNSVDSLVDTTDTFLAVDIHEGSKSGLGRDTRSSHLVLGDLNRLHAGAETHGGIGLCDTTGDTSDDTTTKLASAEATGMVFGLGGDEEENSALGGGFDPGPGDKTLVNCKTWLAYETG